MCVRARACVCVCARVRACVRVVWTQWSMHGKPKCILLSSCTASGCRNCTSSAVCGGSSCLSCSECCSWCLQSEEGSNIPIGLYPVTAKQDRISRGILANEICIKVYHSIGGHAGEGERKKQGSKEAEEVSLSLAYIIVILIIWSFIIRVLIQFFGKRRRVETGMAHAPTVVISEGQKLDTDLISINKLNQLVKGLDLGQALSSQCLTEQQTWSNIIKYYYSLTLDYAVQLSWPW